MSKRRRSSVTSEHSKEDDESTVATTPMASPTGILAKRRKKSIADQGVLIQELYDVIRNYKNEDGRIICEGFIRAPKRRTSPEYYEIVTNPIDLLKIQQRIKTEEYESVDDLSIDIQLLVTNTQSFYKRNAVEYKDAVELWDVFTKTKNDYVMEMGRKPEEVKASTSIKDEKDDSMRETDVEDNESEEDECKIGEFTLENPSDPIERLFTFVMAHTDTTERNISMMFRKLPPKSEFPDYYDVIDHPIDLKDIAKKVKGGKYSAMNELEKDLILMVTNAKNFNEPKSQIYKDSYTLKRIFQSKRKDLEKLVAKGGLPSRPSGVVASGTSAISEALNIPSDPEDEDEEEEEEEEEVVEEEEEEEEEEEVEEEEEEEEEKEKEVVEAAADGDEDNQEDEAAGMEYEEAEESGNESLLSDGNDNLYLLFNTVTSFKNAAGQVISEPFMRLPSRRTYPDYYQEIKDPMALCKIRTKLKGSKYENIDELLIDMDLVFNNAKQYNMPNSRLYKDADRLQKVMHTKKKELDSIKKEAESEDESGSKKKLKMKIIDNLRSHMMQLLQALVEYKDEAGRAPIDLFMEKPSKKEYPDYYKVITDPIDVKTIESNILTDKYSSLEMVLIDFDLMFCNARHYNEEGSMVYTDTNTLEKLLHKKCKELNIEIPELQVGKGMRKSPSKKSLRVMTPLGQKLQELYNAIKDHKDASSRELVAPFIRLPSKNEYPEYYQVIKKPIDLQRIQQRMSNKQYEQLDDMVNDFLLMFDNACKFNEPDSLIYKDALTLQRVLLQTRTELSGDESSGVPDVQGIVREILTSLFVSVANHQDEEGRCYSDSLAEIPVEKDKEKEFEMPEETRAHVQKKPLDLDTVRRYLDRGCYKRLDVFQDHMFDVFERARSLSRTDSQVYEDAIELQKFFIKIRDEICKNGEILLSPALSYTDRHMQNDVEAQKQEKLPKELKEDADKKEEEARGDQEGSKDGQETKGEEDLSDGIVVQGVTYRVGDFIYVEPSEKQLKPHIVCIEKLWRDSDGEGWLHGNWFLRPNETFHLATRKFLEKEVFKSDYYNKVKISQHVIAHCFVMFVKDYFKQMPEGFTNEDVYVCESRYSAKAKAFKKIKLWSVPLNVNKIIPREEPLSKVRVASVFAGAREPSELNRGQEGESYHVFDKERENVEIDLIGEEETNKKFYEQLNYNLKCYKLGDSLFVSFEGRKRPAIARVDKIWKDENGEAYFQGPTLMRPYEVQHPPTRMFYRNELFLSSAEDETFSFTRIIKKVAVMSYKNYIISRPTEFMEQEVFVCESQYKEQEQQMRKIKSLRRYSVANKVIDDEIYFFKKPITPLKEPSPLLQPDSMEESDDEVMKEAIADIDEDLGTETSSVTSTPKVTRKNRSASGFILFASEIRASVKSSNPNSSFGEISRLCGLEWHKLLPEEKVRYEERASVLAESRPPKPSRKAADSPAPVANTQPREGMLLIYECLWENCEFQYEAAEDLVHHILETSNHMKDARKDGESQTEFPCRWKGCTRYKRNQPFPVFGRLIRHCKEVHVKNATRHVYPHQLGRNYFPRNQQGMPGQAGGAIMGIVGPPTPVGMATQQLQHGMPPRYPPGYQTPGGTPDMHGQMMPGTPQGHYPNVPYQQQTPQGMVMQQHQQMPQQQMQPQQMMQGGHMGQPYQQQPQPGMMPLPSHGHHPQPHPMQPMSQPMGLPMMHPYPMSASPHMGGMPNAPYHPGIPQPQIQQPIPAQQPPPPPAPMFVAPPPKTQRVLHSEAYIRYIEGLSSKSECISDWRQNLSAKQEDLNLSEQQKAQLPGHWFANGPGKDGDVVKALWKLRDLMMQDSLKIANSYDICDLREDETPTPPTPVTL